MGEIIAAPPWTVPDFIRKLVCQLLIGDAAGSFHVKWSKIGGRPPVDHLRFE